MIWSPLFMRSYPSNETEESHQQPPTEKQSTKKDSSSTDMLLTNNKMCDRGIQTDIIFVQKPQGVVSEAKSFDDDNLVIKPTPPIPGQKKRSQISYPYAIKTSSLWNQAK